MLVLCCLAVVLVQSVCLSVPAGVGSLLSGGRLGRQAAGAVPAASGTVLAVSHLPLPVRRSAAHLQPAEPTYSQPGGAEDHCRQRRGTGRHPRHSAGKVERHDEV